ncbi:MAG: signal transduction histidine kinase [Bacteriovoracaceae bacterium]
MYLEYESGKSDLIEGFSGLSEPDRDLIANSIWFLDKGQIGLELRALRMLPAVKLVKVYTEDGEIYEDGSLDDISSLKTYKYDLFYKGGDAHEKVGVLEIVGTFDELKRVIFNKTIDILIGQTIKTFIVSFFILSIYLSLIGNRLNYIARFTNKLNIGSLEEKLKVNDRSGDELDEISKTINLMTERLKHQLKEQELEQEEKLIIKKKFYEDQKIKALGSLAGGISHDFNNILQGIMLTTDLCEEAFLKGIEPKKELESLRKITLRGKKLTEKILLFSKNESKKLVAIDLVAIVNDSLQLFKLSLEAGIKLETTLPENPIYITADPVQIDQLMINLLSNASQAFTRTIKNKTVTLKVKEEPSFVLIMVSDNGIGISKDVQERMFEPFFSTKAIGKGTGLGLSISKSIVENHQGVIEVTSTMGKGSSFVIKLPKS